MNRLIISVILVILLHEVSIAQKYYPIDTSNVVWNELKESCSGNTYPPYKFIETYFISGDTIIDNLRFYKIYIRESNDSLYGGCFREEDKRIYYTGADYFGFEIDSVVLLYDFNKQKNDTLYTGTWHWVVIDDIDSILIGDSYRKRFQMNDGQYWIEGIGSTFGFLYPMTDMPTYYWRSGLICYKHNDTLLYLSTNFVDCYTEKQISPEWAPIGAKWYYDHYCCLGAYLTVIESVGDTIINDKNCRILISSTTAEYMNPDGSYYWKTSSGYPEYLYYENDTIYHYNNETESFYVLYAFNVKPKDTVVVREGDPDCQDLSSDCSRFEYIVDSISEIQLNNQKLKLIYTSDTDSTYWTFSASAISQPFPVIELIGATSYFFGKFYISVEGSICCLRCYVDSNLFYRSDKWLPDKPCDYIRPLSGANSSDDVLVQGNSVYPNPFYLSLTIESNQTKIISYQLINSQGRVIMKDKIYSNKVLLNTEDLLPGIYYIQYNFENLVNKTQKLIKYTP